MAYIYITLQHRSTTFTTYPLHNHFTIVAIPLTFNHFGIILWISFSSQHWSHFNSWFIAM